MKKILYVEDDLSLIDGLKYTLEKNHFAVDVARTVKEAHTLYQTGPYDLILLDVTLPDGTGYDVCGKIRQTSTVPIIFLTASDEEVNIVRGLDMGGDDYITKPFKLGEVLSRINALLRRTVQFRQEAGARGTNTLEAAFPGDLTRGAVFPDDKILETNGIKVSFTERTVWKGEVQLDLTLAEYKLLCLFLQNPDRVLSRELILDRLWDGNGCYVDDNTLSVYIRRLRRKVEDNPNSPTKLVTERGFGYKWVKGQG